jgi:2-amino-4-hydroxy-6-hydroxymethyldihydropteridine diphosphokinase
VAESRNRVIIALGSNLEDRVENCRRAVSALQESGLVTVAAQSGYFLSEPVGYADQPWYVNAVLMARTSLSPDALLRFLQRLEKEAGRTSCKIRNGPRVLDLDIIFFNDWIIESEGLVVPHPRMQERGFVLKPLAEIAADWIHPVYQKSVRRLLAEAGSRHETCVPMAAMYNSGLKRMRVQ